MALNWVMVEDAHRRPVALEGEATFYAADAASLHVQHKATGQAFVTSQRIIFIRQPLHAYTPGPSALTDLLQTLSVPLDHFQGWRYVIPIFAAAYIEADVYAVQDGGLPQRDPGQASAPKGKLKLWFNEGGGLRFKDAIEKAKKDWEQTKQSKVDEDTLPAYEPTLPAYEPPSQQ